MKKILFTLFFFYAIIISGQDSLKYEIFTLREDDFYPEKSHYIPKISLRDMYHQNFVFPLVFKNGSLVIRSTYSGENWLFIQKVVFSIDGKITEFIPDGHCLQEHEDGIIYEECNTLVKHPMEFLNQIINASNVKLRIYGRDYFVEDIPHAKWMWESAKGILNDLKPKKKR